jgi:hypothetical protein
VRATIVATPSTSGANRGDTTGRNLELDVDEHVGATRLEHLFERRYPRARRQRRRAQHRERRVGDPFGTPAERTRSSSWKTTTSPVPHVITSSSTPSAPSARARANAAVVFSVS